MTMNQLLWNLSFLVAEPLHRADVTDTVDYSHVGVGPQGADDHPVNLSAFEDFASGAHRLGFKLDFAGKFSLDDSDEG